MDYLGELIGNIDERTSSRKHRGHSEVIRSRTLETPQPMVNRRGVPNEATFL
jgi:hypothetical protein